MMAYRWFESVSTLHHHHNLHLHLAPVQGPKNRDFNTGTKTVSGVTGFPGYWGDNKIREWRKFIWQWTKEINMVHFWIITMLVSLYWTESSVPFIRALVYLGRLLAASQWSIYQHFSHQTECATPFIDLILQNLRSYILKAAPILPQNYLWY